MKIKHIYIGFSLCCLTFLLLTAFMVKPAANLEHHSGPAQKIKFSHKFHKDLIECAVCHSNISESSSLNEKLFPRHEDCASCHDVTDQKNCNFCHFGDIREKLQFNNTKFIFSHKNHIAQKQECKNCHSGIEESEYLAEGVHFKPKMAVCYTCHNEGGIAPNACETCHASLVNLKPQNHLVNNYLRFHKYQALSPSANCVMCHTTSSCNDCHSATSMMTENNTKFNFSTPYSTSMSTYGTAQQKVTRVHDLGFRLSHAIEARSKSKECTTCHETAAFCSECHRSNKEDFSFGGLFPASHTKPTFMIIGVGSGGGDHATLARRDIESCASCHDAQGNDPACIKCHFDNDGIKGNNPKTHKSGFMRSNEGDWHTNSGSICYSCHTDPNAHPGGTPGVGFCNYCHGKK